jgi:single-stranded-DNA-specific exonuclease
MKTLDIPLPKIKPRSLDKKIEQLGLSKGLHPLLARVVAARPLPSGFGVHDVLHPKLECLDHPLTMQDMTKAAHRVAKAIYNKECIGLETDHDCDGQTSHAVLYHNLVYHFKHPKELLKSYIGHRLKEGYGLSASVANRILEDSPRPSLLITADNGSSDEARIKQLAAVGMDVIVTDHHQIPEDDYPNSAYAFLNPTRDDCNYNDKYIAGCMVAWLLMAAVRLQLIEDKYLNINAPKLVDSLDFVAVGTIADCVSIARSKNNRAVVNYGMKLISQGVKPCWQVLLPLLSNPISSQDLGFKIGPLLNSDGRLSSALGSVSFLL